MARNIRTDETRRDIIKHTRYNKPEAEALANNAALHGYADESKFIRELTTGKIEGKQKATPEISALLERLNDLAVIRTKLDETDFDKKVVMDQIGFIANAIHIFLPK